MTDGGSELLINYHQLSHHDNLAVESAERSWFTSIYEPKKGEEKIETTNLTSFPNNQTN